MDAVPYPGFAFPQTHPDRLYLLGLLHGLEPAPPDRCRVLEIGCGDGLNLVAMAAHSPGIEAVGFDRVLPAAGRSAAADLDLRSVELERRDLRQAQDLGMFDYVIAHGIYAWVPADARDALLALLSASLAPHGVAFLSYNALPGARLRTMLRELALLHAGGLTEPRERVERARELYELIAPWASGRPDAYGGVLASELDRLRGLSTASLAHDDLGPVYEPAWLRDVVAHAAGHGLRYVADADLEDLRAARHPADVDEQLDALAAGDPVVWEQYADMLAGRQFRQTLLCRAEAPAGPVVELERLTRLAFAATPAAGLGEAPAHAGNGDGNGDAGAGAVAWLARRRPRVLTFAELRADLGGPDPAALADELWHGFRAGELDLHAGPARHVLAPGALPDASPIARWQAARGPELTNLRHESVRLDDPLGRHLLTLCDGTRDRRALVDALVAGAGSKVRFVSAGVPVGDPESLRRPIADGLEHSLRALARLALLRA